MCAEMLYSEATTHKALFSPNDIFGKTHTEFGIWISLHLYWIYA